MKRVFVLFCLLCSFTAFAVAETVNINLTASVIEDEPVGNEGPRSPVLIPHVCLEDYILFFDTPCDGCELRIVAANGDVEYSTVIPSGATTLVLPSYLSGTYEIQIIRGNFCFWGYIML